MASKTSKSKATKKKKTSKVAKPISNVGGGQGGLLSSFGQASSQGR